MPDLTSDFTREFNTVFAAAYRDAVMQEADMPALAAVLEPIRRQWKETGDTLLSRAALDTAVGGNDDPNAETALGQLRSDFHTYLRVITFMGWGGLPRCPIPG